MYCIYTQTKEGKCRSFRSFATPFPGYLGARIEYFSNRLEEGICEKEEEEEATWEIGNCDLQLFTTI